MTQRRPIWSTLLRLALLAIVALAAIPGGKPAQVASAANNLLHISVVSARTEPKFPNGAPGAPGITAGTRIATYKFIINEDNVGNPNQPRSPDCSPSSASYPAKCHWPSIQAMTGSSPIVTQGDETVLDDATHGLTLPNGNYLISVMADNFKIDGAHFSIPLDSSSPVEVQMQPLPLPTATLRAQVFEDNAPVNSGPDLPAERGLAGFRAAITDSLGEVTTDVYGNPLCTKYVTSNGQIVLDADGAPTPIPGTGGSCLSDANGIIEIPNLGPNRYALSAIPPDGSNWVQTTTLEGNHDWDSWLQEGATGNDTEFAIAGEPFPATIVGFVKPTALPAGGTGEIKGVVDAVKVYVPLNGGLPYSGGLWGGLSGAKIDQPIENPWIALSSLQNGDQAVYVGQGKADGSFDIKNVPPGDYTLTYWDGPQNYILDLVQVTVKANEVVDVGNLFLTGWFTKIEGYVFNDVNENGKRDAGEPGVSGYNVALKRRTNTVMDRGSTLVVTDPTGHYVMENAYPLTQWLVVEAYNDRYRTTGVTYQTDNQPTPTTVLGAGVDVNVLPIIGQSGQLDWGVKPYTRTENGGIVGTVSYDTTRNELNPRFAAVENWQPGIPGLNVRLYQPVDCGTNPGAACDNDGVYELDSNGAYAKGKLLNTYVTETWARPKDCQARDVDGKPVDQQVLPPATGGYDCLEGPLMGVQFDEEFATVDGNYGFGDGCFGLGGYDEAKGACADGSDPTALTAGDYLVDVEIPNDSFGKPMYQVTREEDINIFSGNQYVPQIPPPACAGPLHTVDLADSGTDGYDPVTLPNGVTVPASTPTANPDFVDGGGSPYEGQQTPLCSTKLVTVSNGRSVAPTFNLFTEVPVPGRFYGYIVDDLNLSTNPQDLLFGEKAGVPNSPVGIYDFSNRLVTTVNSDPNGIFDVLLPSTTTINCPSPSGVCTNLYRMVGNDPGVPGALNPNYNPQFRTIAATFELFPGDIIPADLAPTQVGVSIQGPGSQFNSSVTCALDTATPQLFAVSKPYVRITDGGAARNIVIRGTGFGANPGSVTLDGTTVLPIVGAWSDTQITVNVPLATAFGAHQLMIKGSNGQSTVNGLTFHVLSGNGNPNNGAATLPYNPRVREVGPGKTYSTIQSAIDAAAGSNINSLVVVYPGGVPDSSNPQYNPRKAYFENLVIAAPVKLQGVGPGGVYPNKSVVEGSIIDGGAFGGDTALADAWRTRVGNLNWVGNQNPYEAQTIYLLAQSTNQYAANATYKPAIDGFSVQGGDQAGFPNNINQIGGGPTGLPATVQTQGGGIFANAYVRGLQITNNILQNNAGAYGGAIRIGTPDLPAPDTNNHNENLRIANNRVIANGGTNLAGGIGIFAGADGYEIANNDICGNFSAEYGGAISHYGASPNGQIHHNRIYFNRSYDEGGAIMIAGQLPANPNTLSPGSGPVDIHDNLIQGNLSNDDGGGIRFLMAGNFAFNVYNNMIVNNISTHEGGGIALDDAPNVRVYNNTIMKNITTATAATSNGLPAPAGISTTGNSTLLQATLPSAAPKFSNPLLFNNIFWDNRAGTWTGGGVAGIGLAGDPNAINHWDLGVADSADLLAPTNSVIQQSAAEHPYTTAASNRSTNPAVASTYDLSVAVFPWRTNVNFVNAAIVAVEAPANLLGNYHLAGTGSPAFNLGAASAATVSAPAADIDGDVRPSLGGYDSGADEIRATTANLSISKTDGQTTAPRGSQVTYTIVVANAGPDAINGALVNDTMPAALTGATWTCVASGGSSCGAASGSGNIANVAVSLLNGGTATFTVVGTVSGSAAIGSQLSNTATVAVPAGATDPALGNNSATDSDTIVLPVDLSITKTDGVTLVNRGSQVRYTIVVANPGPNAVTGATVTDSFPNTLSGTINWTCTTTGGATCGGGGTGSGNINRTVNLPAGSSVTFTTTSGSVSTSTLQTSLSNTATVGVPASYVDTNTVNNSATDTDTINSVHVGDLDRSSANTSTTQWSASVTITVHDANHNPVAGATVTGGWPLLNGGSCTTNASGQCTLTRAGLSRSNTSSVTFAVLSVSHAPDSYQLTLNHDPDTGAQASNGTTISVPRP
jgi:uncharacterized repeat protein (TIGR01451 family)